MPPRPPAADLVEVHDAQGRVTAAEIIVLDSFRVQPGQLSVAVNAVARFSAAGGQPPYSYELAGGKGAIDPETGDYAAPAVTGEGPDPRPRRPGQHRLCHGHRHPAAGAADRPGLRHAGRGRLLPLHAPLEG